MALLEMSERVTRRIRQFRHPNKEVSLNLKLFRNSKYASRFTSENAAETIAAEVDGDVKVDNGFYVVTRTVIGKTLYARLA